jgi:hypothetical protein
LRVAAAEADDAAAAAVVAAPVAGLRSVDGDGFPLCTTSCADDDDEEEEEDEVNVAAGAGGAAAAAAALVDLALRLLPPALTGELVVVVGDAAVPPLPLPVSVLGFLLKKLNKLPCLSLQSLPTDFRFGGGGAMVTKERQAGRHAQEGQHKQQVPRTRIKE